MDQADEDKQVGKLNLRHTHCFDELDVSQVAQDLIK